VHERAACDMAREQSNNTELKFVDTLFNFASTDQVVMPY
jgi:hypothetical protein